MIILSYGCFISISLQIDLLYSLSVQSVSMARPHVVLKTNVGDSIRSYKSILINNLYSYFTISGNDLYSVPVPTIATNVIERPPSRLGWHCYHRHRDPAIDSADQTGVQQS